VRAKPAQIVQEPEIEVAAVHHEVPGGQSPPDFVERDARSQDIDEENLSVDQKLQQAKPGAVMKHVVRLGIEGDFVHAVQGGEQRCELPGLVDELKRRRTSGHFHPEQTAKAERKEARNHEKIFALRFMRRCMVKCQAFWPSSRAGSFLPKFPFVLSEALVATAGE